MVVCSISSKLGLPECYENRTEPIATNAPPACSLPELLFWSLGCGLWLVLELMLGRCSLSTYPKKRTCFFRNSFVLLNKKLPVFGMWWQCHSKTPLIQLISTIQAYKLLYACDFFCSPEIYKKVLNTLVTIDFICKEFVTSDQAHSPWISRSSTAAGFPQACCSCQAGAD